MRVGDYVQIIRIPEPWEGAGESYEDRESFLYHVGRVAEIDEELETAFVTFMCKSATETVGGRNIEFRALGVVASPRREISNHFWDSQ